MSTLSNSISWLSEFRIRLFINVMKSTNHCLDDLDSRYGHLRRQMPNWHGGLDIRYWFIANLRHAVSADENLKFLEIGNAVAVIADNSFVLHFLKYDPSSGGRIEERLAEAQTILTESFIPGLSVAPNPVVHIQPPLPGFPVRPKEFKVGGQSLNERDILVEYATRGNRLLALHFALQDVNGLMVTQTIREYEAKEPQHEVRMPPSTDVELKNIRRDEDKNAQ